MQILHITQSSNGYEEVKLIANRHSRKNHMAVIEKNGKKYITGGYLINDTPEIRAVLDNILPEEQYIFVQSFKQEPFAALYYAEHATSFTDAEKP